MALLTFGAMAVALSISAFWLRNIILGTMATFGWMLLAGTSFALQTGMNDPNFYSFIFGIAMTIVMPIAMFEIYHTAKQEKEDYTQEKEWKIRERNEPKLSLYGGADKLRIKHGMGLSAISERRKANQRTGWD